jgi:hypothetical protein
MQSQEMEMKQVLNTIAQLLLRTARRRAELVMRRQSLVHANAGENYRSNAGGWN